jgi:ectoine hydroxylase-related dioxygenase (phytanoyl-CoA dioxygenase family)
VSLTKPAHDYGVLERARVTDDVAAHSERIRVAGFTVVDGGFTSGEVAEFGQRLDAALAQQRDEFGYERLAAIGDEWTVRCPLVHDAIFLRLVTHLRVLAICRNLLGEYVVLMQQNGVINPPRQTHSQTAYHRDLPYQHFTSSRPLALSAIFCIDPFRKETGATTVLPATHRVETFPDETVAATLDTSVEADAGSFIVFDSMLFHRAGENQAERPRRAVNQVFSIPLIAQQISLPLALEGRYREDPALARLLGYEAMPAASALAWRERRVARRS